MAQSHSTSAMAVRIGLPIVILVVGVGGFLAIGGRQPPSTREEEKDDAPLVRVVPAEVHDGGLTVETDGVVVPFREISLSSEVAGRVVTKTPECQAGCTVAEGELLVEIDPRTYQLEVDRLTKELEQAKLDIEEVDVERQNTQELFELAEQDLGLQQRDVGRLEKLHAKNVTTAAELDAARRNELAAKNALQTFRNQLRTLGTKRSKLERAIELAQTRLDKARLDLERAEVRSPIDGVIVRDLVERDSFVQPGTSLVTIEDISAMEVHCDFEMDELHLLWQHREEREAGGAATEGRTPRGPYRIPQARATVLYELGGRTYAWDGHVAGYDGVGLDEKTRTVPCRVLVPEPQTVRLDGEPGPVPGGPKALMRGMFVRVLVHVGSDEPLLRVPQQSLRPGGTVWVARGESLKVVPVTVAQFLDDDVLVRGGPDGLAAGDRVVVSPLSTVEDGMAVREQVDP